MLDYQSQHQQSFDYSFVSTTARIALYDDMKSAPRITCIEPAPTDEFIEKLASTIDEQAKRLGGNIPYTAVREVSENLIHAQFREIVVSILDKGDTICFADQGPGIMEKEKAQKPGFTSATEPMKKYIRGVGSGLPIVREWIVDRNGSLVIDDNLSSGAVVTLSLVKKPSSVPSSAGIEASQPLPLPHIQLDDRQQLFLRYLLSEGELRITDLVEMTDMPNSSAFNILSKLEQEGLVEKTPNRKRSLTQLGVQIARSL